MKRIILFLSFFILFVSCRPKTDHLGKWSGSVLMVQTIYQFSEDGLFSTETYSSNRIMIGGGTGLYTLEGDNLCLQYEKKYACNSQTDSGEWIEDNKVLNFQMDIAGNIMVLIRQGSGIQIKLQRD